MKFSIVNSVSEQASLQTFNELVGEKSIQELEALSPKEVKAIIQQAGLANLLIPKALGGQELSLVQGLEVIQEVAARCPSAALMLCMHYHVVVTLVQFVEMVPGGAEILHDVANNNALVASAFAEGVPGQDIFVSGVKALQLESSVKIKGSKKPCTMSSVADYYAVSISDHEDPNIAGVAFVKQGSEGVEHRDFWTSDLLKASDTNEVHFNNVEVPAANVVMAPAEALGELLGFGLATFNFMTCCAYTGVVQSLAQKLPELGASRNSASKISAYVEVYGKLLQTHYATIGFAATFEQALMAGVDGEELINLTLMLRYRTQASIKELAIDVIDNVGGMRYLFDKEVTQLANIANLLSFHPVNRSQFEQQLQQQFQ